MNKIYWFIERFIGFVVFSVIIRLLLFIPAALSGFLGGVILPPIEYSIIWIFTSKYKLNSINLPVSSFLLKFWKEYSFIFL